MIVKLDELKSIVLMGVNKLGYQDKDAEIITNVLLYAQLRGNNQGITKIATGGVPKAADVKAYKVVNQNKCGALVSGGHAMVATHNAVGLACDLADTHGIGVVASNHTFTSSGAVGYFSRAIADKGYIGLICVGTPPFVAPTGSAEPKLGTNPLTYAFPTSSGSIVFDTATAAMAFFGVLEAKLKGEALPENIAFDVDGNFTTDPSKALQGSVSTFAGHKGFGLSLLVQLLGGPFADAAYIGQHKDKGAGTFVMAIDPGLLVGKDAFMQHANDLKQQIKSAKPLPGEQVLLPGEHGDQLMQQIESSGEIEIANAIWNELCDFVSGAIKPANPED